MEPDNPKHYNGPTLREVNSPTIVNITLTLGKIIIRDHSTTKIIVTTKKEVIISLLFKQLLQRPETAQRPLAVLLSSKCK